MPCIGSRRSARESRADGVCTRRSRSLGAAPGTYLTLPRWWRRSWPASRRYGKGGRDAAATGVGAQSGWHPADAMRHAARSMRSPSGGPGSSGPRRGRIRYRGARPATATRPWTRSGSPRENFHFTIHAARLRAALRSGRPIQCVERIGWGTGCASWTTSTEYRSLGRWPRTCGDSGSRWNCAVSNVQTGRRLHCRSIRSGCFDCQFRVYGQHR